MNTQTFTTGLRTSLAGPLAWLSCAAIAACGTTVSVTTAGAGPSGVQGGVSLSPTCGGAQREGTDCRAAYADVELRLLSASGEVVASARTSADGQYRLPAAAGRYRLQVVGRAKPMRCPVPDVVVSDGAFSTVDISCDTGMR